MQQAELNSDVALSAATALLTHLRKNPQAAMAPARELAEAFNLDEAFVAQVLQGVSGKKRPDAKPMIERTSLLRGLGLATRALWDKLTLRPVVFVAVSTLLCILISIGAAYGIPALYAKEAPAEPGTIPAAILVCLAVILSLGAITFFLHMGVYFRHRRPKIALFGGCVIFAFLMAGFTLIALQGKATSTSREAGPLVIFLLGATGLLVLSLMYAGMGSLSAVLGGWARIKMEDKATESMTRQELLERYFELQSRLQMSAYPRPSGYEPAMFASPIVAWYRDHQLVVNPFIGFAASTLGLLILRASGIRAGDPNPEINLWFFAIVFLGVGEFLFYILQGYLSKSVLRAAVGGVCILIGKTAAAFLPIGDGTLRRLGAAQFSLSQSVELAMIVGVSAAGYLGAVVQSRSIRDANLQRNDQATLLAEMVRIQWKLSNEASSICVLVVDAAKSSEMKASVDPLTVEYTFREYQDWLKEICVARQGRILSTAGDGAVVTFSSCALALSAARKIQTDVFQFNKDVNRLQQPFRLRIGLHVGEVVGDINEVQFTEVIDIAAHIEAASPIGGIAATDAVAERLPDEQFIDLGIMVDNHQVFMIKNPSEFQ